MQLSKELRALRWAGLAGCALAILPAVLPRFEFPMVAWFALLFLAGVLPGIEIFGHEFAQNTFTLLMVQPTPRARIWRRKMAALALVLGAMFLAALAGGLTQGPGVAGGGAMEWVWLGTLLGSGAGCGLFWVLVTRQSGAAFWLALIGPGLLGTVGALAIGKWWGDEHREMAWVAWIIAVPLAGTAAWLGAIRLFRSVEDVGLSNAEISLPAKWFGRRVAERSIGGGPGLERRRRQALIRKEFKLQQFSVVLALIFGLVLALVFAVELFPGLGKGAGGSQHLGGLWILWFLAWAVIPFTVGATAIAEERRLGLSDWQFTLPATIGQQWRTKAMVVYGLSFVLGVLLPLALESVALVLFDLADYSYAMVFAVRLVFWFGGTTLGLYGSSLSRNLVQSLSIGLGLLVILVVALGGLTEWLHRLIAGWASLLIPWRSNLESMVILGAVVLLLPTLAVLSWSNYRRGTATAGSLRRNVLAIGLALAVTMTFALGMVTRAWELVAPGPRPGPALAQRPGVAPRIVSAFGFSVAVLTPDGGLWGWWSSINYRGIPPISASPGAVRLSPDSNWVDLAANWVTLFAVKGDGSLWRLNHPLAARMSQNALLTGVTGSSWRGASPSLERVGSDTDWKAVAVGSSHVVALKQDGSLWGWGNNQHGQLGRDDLEKTDDLVRIGADRRWELVAAGLDFTVAAESERGIWAWGVLRSGLPGTAGEGNTSRAKGEPKLLAKATDWARLESRTLIASVLAFTADGTLRSVDARPSDRFSGARREVEFVADRRWRDVASSLGILLGVDPEGRLVRVSSGHGLSEAALRAAPLGIVPIGSRRDWMVLGGGHWNEGLHGLTADGVLWRWQPRRMMAPSWFEMLVEDFIPEVRLRPLARLAPTTGR